MITSPYVFNCGQQGAMWMSGKISEKNLKLKRAYERPTDSDGKRVLVDRLWPRGVRKTDAAIDYWVKELAPSWLKERR